MVQMTDRLSINSYDELLTETHDLATEGLPCGHAIAIPGFDACLCRVCGIWYVDRERRLYQTYKGNKPQERKVKGKVKKTIEKPPDDQLALW